MFWMNATEAFNSCIRSKIMANPKPQKKPKTNDNMNVSGDNDEVVMDTKNDSDDSVVSDTEYRDNYSIIINPKKNHRILEELVLDTTIDLSKVDRLDVETLRKKVLDLFKIRRIMKTNMTASGTHDNDPWKFVEVAMKTKSGFYKEQLRQIMNEIHAKK
jgi:hypothetical protein